MTEYKQMIFILNKNLYAFKKSVKSCDIPSILDNNIVFIDTLRNANKIFESLSPKAKIDNATTNDKSKELAMQYFDVRSRINSICSCVTKK